MGEHPRVRVFSLGGTIAMAEASSGGQGVTPELDASDLLAAVPALADAAEIDAASFRRVPGVELTLADVVALADAIDTTPADAVVVTQGTDTLEETAFLLDLLLGDERPVVVTGAMRSADAAGADGPANLLAAVRLAASGATRGAGVTVVFGDDVHAAALCRKAHTARPAAFVSDPGPIGSVTEGVPRVVLAPRSRYRLGGRPSGDARVALAAVGFGDDGSLLRAVASGGFDGIVVDAAGGGHVPVAVAEQIEPLAAALPVVLTARTRAGRVLTRTYGFPGGEIDLLRRGVVTAGTLDGPKARVLLMALLATGAARDEITAAFEAFGGQAAPRA